MRQCKNRLAKLLTFLDRILYEKLYRCWDCALGLSGAAFAEGTTEEKKKTETAAATTTETAAATDTATGGAEAFKKECKAGEAYRKIWIEYGNDAGEKCKVNYVRDQEPVRVLWSAENDPNYCLDKAKGLVEGTLSAFKCVEFQ